MKREWVFIRSLGIMKREWVFIRSLGHAYRCECLRCESFLDVGLPVAMDDFLDVIKVYGQRHKRCSRTLRSERRELCALLRRRANPGGGSFTFTLGIR